MAENNPMGYKEPGVTESTIGTQLVTEYFQKKALIELKKVQFFSQLADTISMPKHMGKTIKRYHYIPLLDDANINDQGIDASGATASFESTITVKGPDATGTAGTGLPMYFVGQDAAVDATAITAAKTAFINWVKQYFPAVYAAMPHTTIAADYALQIAAATVKQVVTKATETVAENDVYTLTYDGVTLTSTALDATPTVAELVAALVGGANAAAYAAMPFLLTVSGTDMVATWKLAGVVKKPITFARTVGTALAVAPVITTLGATTLYSMGYRMTLNASMNGAGNLYGSSKDIGTISAKLPALTENGGRVNRVGFKRVELEGSIEKFGFFDEYTQESLDFDSDADLEMHINREMLNGANELTEDMLQIDLLNSAGIIRYGGAATGNADMTGVTADTVSEVNYEDFSRLDIELNNNRTPKHTTIITGSRMVDTKVIPACRVMYMGSEMQPTIERLTDHFNNQAYIPLAHYAAAGSELNGEIGTVGHFRICVVPEMMHWAGVGADEGVNAGYRATGGKYDVFPLLTIGDESFTTIGFQTSGKSVKFKIYHKKPGEATADRNDPYGETGFMSIKWYYGFMALRPERIALIKSVARL